MIGLVPVIHALFAARKTWMRGTSPIMTDTNERNALTRAGGSGTHGLSCYPLPSKPSP